jgi:hypothetical protein
MVQLLEWALECALECMSEGMLSASHAHLNPCAAQSDTCRCAPWVRLCVWEARTKLLEPKWYEGMLLLLSLTPTLALPLLAVVIHTGPHPG